MSVGGGTGKGASGGDIYSGSAAALAGAGSGLQQSQTLLGKPGVTGQSYTASTVANPSKISSGIAGYMNPYTDSVIDNAIADQQRLTDLQQGVNGAAATNAGAFGGSRHGLVEAVTNSEAQRNIGNLSGTLRQAGFDTAAGLSAADIANQMNTGQFNAVAKNQAGQWGNQFDIYKSQDEIQRAQGLGGLAGQAAELGKTGVDIGQTLMGNQAQAGSQQQNLIQQLMTLAGGQYQNFMQRPQQMMDLLLSASGMSPLNNQGTQTETYNPGLLDYLGLGGQTAVGLYGAPGKGGAKT